MGHRTSPNARPILRLVLLNIAKLASLVSTVLTAYFWYSRVLSTGISLPAHAINTLVHFVAFGAGVVQRGDKMDWMMSPVVVLISALVWSLCQVGVGWWRAQGDGASRSEEETGDQGRKGEREGGWEVYVADVGRGELCLCCTLTWFPR
jgi:hypothetical protein